MSGGDRADYVSLSVAARLLGISRQAVHQRVKRGRLRGHAMDVGKGRIRWCIPRDVIDALLHRGAPA